MITKNPDKPELAMPTHPKDVHVTIGILESFGQRIEAQMQAGFKMMEARFTQSDARMDRLEAKFDSKIDQLEAKFDSKFDGLRSEMQSGFKMIDARFIQMDAKIEGLRGDLATATILGEEQHGQNKAVFEGILNVQQGLQRIDNRLNEHEKIIASIARTKNKRSSIPSA